MPELDGFECWAQLGAKNPCRSVHPAHDHAPLETVRDSRGELPSLSRFNKARARPPCTATIAQGGCITPGDLTALSDSAG